MSAICDVIVIFPIYGQFGAIIRSNLSSYKKLKIKLKNL